MEHVPWTQKNRGRDSLASEFRRKLENRSPFLTFDRWTPERRREIRGRPSAMSTTSCAFAIFTKNLLMFKCTQNFWDRVQLLSPMAGINMQGHRNIEYRKVLDIFCLLFWELRAISFASFNDVANHYFTRGLSGRVGYKRPNGQKPIASRI